MRVKKERKGMSDRLSRAERPAGLVAMEDRMIGDTTACRSLRGDDRRGAVGGRYALTPDGLEGGHAGQSHVVVADLLMPDAYTVARCSTLLLTVRGLRSFLRKLKIEMNVVAECEG
nr:hypothetical protein Iba_chr02dCG2770 [Ipomoea batatas]